MYYEDLILNKIEKAKEEIDALREEMESADSENTNEISTLLNHQIKYLSSLENALCRVRNGTFGVCEETGEFISEDRLNAVPNSNMSTHAKNIYNSFFCKKNKS